MKNSNYHSREQECELHFLNSGPFYNANTPENHPIIFTKDEDYKTAMSILALSAMSFPDVKIYAFQIMSNHIHLVACGEASLIQDFFKFFSGRLRKHFNESIDRDSFKLKLFQINDLSYLRNAIAYVNRNGFVVNDDVTPFSYPWGSSAYYFQDIIFNFENNITTTIGLNQVRRIMHSRYLDKFKDIPFVNGYISPLEFCHIKEAEAFFRNAKQYFYLISRNVEAYSEIAKTIGESLFYTDNDLYLIAVKLSGQLYQIERLIELNPEQKIEMAKRLHYDYNASDKQLVRMLKIPQDILKSLF